jgi:hypothetical protein
MRFSSLTLAAAGITVLASGPGAWAQVSCVGLPAFQSCTAYASGASVVFNNTKYTSIAPIPSNRDCPPNSPYDPSTDNWWRNDGPCSGATPTSTARPTPTATSLRATPTRMRPTATVTATRATATARRARPTATRMRATPTATQTVTPTATATATPTSPIPAPVPWRLNTAYSFTNNTRVLFNGGLYLAEQAHTSSATNHPGSSVGASLWRNVSTPTPRCTPAINVTTNVAAVSVGQSLTVTASGNVGNGIWGVTVLDGATGLPQDTANPIVTTTQPTAGVNHPPTTISWTFTAARAGFVAFSVGVSGEGPIPGCTGFAAASASALSRTVTAGGAVSRAPVLQVRSGFINCEGAVGSPVRLAWGAVSSALSYDVEFSSTSAGPFTPYVSGLQGVSFVHHDRSKSGYYRITAMVSGGNGTSASAFGGWAIPSCPRPPRQTPTATAAP